MADKRPSNGRCPHCERVQPLQGPIDDLRMRRHLYRAPNDKMEDCPGAGRKPKPGTMK